MTRCLRWSPGDLSVASFQSKSLVLQQNLDFVSLVFVVRSSSLTSAMLKVTNVLLLSSSLSVEWVWPQAFHITTVKLFLAVFWHNTDIIVF